MSNGGDRPGRFDAASVDRLFAACEDEEDLRSARRLLAQAPDGGWSMGALRFIVRRMPNPLRLEAIAASDPNALFSLWDTDPTIQRILQNDRKLFAAFCRAGAFPAALIHASFYGEEARRNLLAHRGRAHAPAVEDWAALQAEIAGPYPLVGRDRVRLLAAVRALVRDGRHGRAAIRGFAAHGLTEVETDALEAVVTKDDGELIVALLSGAPWTWIEANLLGGDRGPSWDWALFAHPETARHPAALERALASPSDRSFRRLLARAEGPAFARIAEVWNQQSPGTATAHFVEYPEHFNELPRPLQATILARAPESARGALFAATAPHPHAGRPAG